MMQINKKTIFGIILTVVILGSGLVFAGGVSAAPAGESGRTESVEVQGKELTILISAIKTIAINGPTYAEVDGNTVKFTDQAVVHCDESTNADLILIARYQADLGLCIDTPSTLSWCGVGKPGSIGKVQCDNICPAPNKNTQCSTYTGSASSRRLSPSTLHSPPNCAIM